MQFVFLLFVNIILWAVFYLVISLKLERSASEFREKKLKAQMDAILRDFNNTAERNISLLENRIVVMKRLLEQSGSLKRIDLSVADMPPAASVTAGRDPGKMMEDRAAEEVSEVQPAAITIKDVVHYSKEVLHTLSGEITSKFSQLRANVLSRLEQRKAESRASAGKETAVVKEVQAEAAAARPLLERSYDEVGPAIARGTKPEKRQLMAEEAILGLFDSTGNKYELVAELYGKGYDAELLSRCSGIPLGEIRLVLNLQKQV